MHPNAEPDAIASIQWSGDKARIIDQTRLPEETVYLEIETAEQMHEAIQQLRIRGAPAIGIAAAYGFYLGIRSIKADNVTTFFQKAETTAEFMASARPTAVNMRWALDRLKQGIKGRKKQPIDQIKQWVLEEARTIHENDKQICKTIGEIGNSIVPDKSQILTHCNTGSLATGLYGTALSVIYHAHASEKKPHVWVDETRPLLQGARLTTWELMRADITCTLITDSTAGSVIKNGQVDLVIVGADRVAANGDVANKIGTYPLAVLANRHQIPFYVAVPLSTIDLNMPSGDQIPIEERNGSEITQIGSKNLAPEGTRTYTPAFDITPYRLVSGIITEAGIIDRKYQQNLRRLKKQEGMSLEDVTE